MKRNGMLFLMALAALLVALLAAGCGQSEKAAEAPSVESASGEQAVAGAPGEAVVAPIEVGSTGKLYVFNWTEYLPEAVIEQFENETGIKVIYSTFESNEAMYAKVKLLGGGGYDLVVPSTYFVAKMAREGMLEPLDKTKLTNLGNLNPAMLDKSYDPGNTYSIPYLWGGTGIMYDSAKTGALSSWNDLWEEKYKDSLLLQDDLREVIGIGLLLTGYSLNDTDEAHLAEAYKMLKELTPNVRVYNSDSPKMPFLNGEVVAGMIWNGEAYTATNENETLKFVWPAEGGIMWMDNFAIPKGARNLDNALTFINFMLRPEISAQACQEYGYPTPNREALKFLPPEVATSPIVFPPDDVLAKSEFQDDVGDAIVAYEKYWELLRAGQ